ncbi:MAG: MBL fold metallo-hydrolase [Halobacteriota archaeon]
MDIARIPVSVATRAPAGTTNAYLVGSDPAVLVDPPARSDALDSAVDARRVGHVLVTHTHPDHVGAVAEYADETGATIWARRGHTDRFEAATGVAPDRLFADGSTLPVDDASLAVLDTPGHAPDHVAVVADGGVLCGDLVVAEGSVVVGAPEGDVRSYLTSLRRLLARSPAALYPGHGPIVGDPPATLRRLLSHRLDRERRVLDAVRSGGTDVDAVVAGAYDKSLDGVADLARATVVAHLEKLAVEGRVTWNPDTERVAPSDGR